MNESFHSNSSYDEQSLDEQRRKERRARRIAQMKKEKERQILIQKCVVIAVPVLVVVIIIALFATHCGKTTNEEVSTVESSVADSPSEESAMNNTSSMESSIDKLTSDTPSQEDTTITQSSPEESSLEATVSTTTGESSDSQSPSSEVASNGSNPTTSSGIIPSASATAATKSLGDEIVSNYAVFIDLDSDTFLAQKNPKTIISPASMTKVLTVLVAAEHMEASQMDDTFTMTLDITDYSYVNDCSNVGFLDGEVITVRDLFYGTALQSGGDAAVGLATYIAGSHEAFVDMMNDKLEELGLSDTAHVTNCVGLYDEDHYCTAYDMAMIMEAAIANDICREVMGARTYTTSFTEQHPEGISISNWFIRRIEDKDTGGKVICAKTGYVVQSGSCAVSYGTDHAGKEYICVTADANSSWRCIYDHVALYKMFSTGQQ